MVQKRPTNIKFRKTFSIDGYNEGFNTNPNTSYVSNPSFWISYAAIVILTSIALHLVLPLSTSVIWTLINFLHSLLTFILFHWMKGGPIEDQYHPHKYDKLTFWEQLDETTQYTPARKFLLFIPCALLLITTFSSTDYLLFNIGVALFVILPKTHFFHGVRLFGINAD